MVISHKHKYIFLRTRKTASSSICAVLNRTLGPKDIQVGGWADALTTGGKINCYMYTRLAANPILLVKELAIGGLSRSIPPFAPGLVNRISKIDFYNKSGFWGEHPSAKNAKNFVGAVWADYHKFCVVRNPWDHAISDYHWRVSGGARISFKEFLYRLADPERPDPEGLRPPVLSNWEIYAIDDKVVADSVIYFEQLPEGLKALENKLHIPLDISGVRQKSDFRSKKPAKDYYDQEAVDLVSLIYRREIEQFDYKVPF